MNILTVSQVNGYVKSILEEDGVLSDVTVAGEISNLKRHTSGHMYFSLKDEKGAIAAAMFKWQCQYLRFAPASGMKVLARGKITLYEPSGQYQMVVSSLQPDGVGELYAAYERLKAQLEREGLFDDARKKPLPKFPQRVGVVTSKTGAAVQDIINILTRRYPLAQIVLCPVAVQGADAPMQIAQAIRRLNREKACDVMIVGRGGGSIEDLWSFNDEGVARAIAASEIPVISAVGHETDFTICDFAADLRAPTPSAAAELAVPDIGELSRYISDVKNRMTSRLLMTVERYDAALGKVYSHPCFTNPLYTVETMSQQLDRTMMRISASCEAKLSECRERLASVAAAMSALDPMRVLARGYCAARLDGEVISSSAALSEGDELQLEFSDGKVSCRVM
ncbi:MAG: exodeoxyribonuclease VII large subunit [Clostridia bacterium]|nr:exodeoxyribonuclease VII large subunit [Clostridia bacterium]